MSTITADDVRSITEYRTFTEKALKAEQGRRRNNKARRANGEPTVKAKGYVLPAMSGPQINTVLAGEPVVVTFKSGRVTAVSLRTNELTA